MAESVERGVINAYWFIQRPRVVLFEVAQNGDCFQKVDAPALHKFRSKINTYISNKSIVRLFVDYHTVIAAHDHRQCFADSRQKSVVALYDRVDFAALFSPGSHLGVVVVLSLVCLFFRRDLVMSVYFLRQNAAGQAADVPRVVLESFALGAALPADVDISRPRAHVLS